MKFIYYISAVLLGVALFSSCKKSENISNIPAITFNSFNTYPDSAVIEINFQDGDGDIGYAADDASAPYNFFAEYLYQDSATMNFIPYINPLASPPDTTFFRYHIPNITPTGKNKTLKGIIKVKIPAPWYLPIYTTVPNIVEYRVWIFDRALHKSNVITTTAVQVH